MSDKVPIPPEAREAVEGIIAVKRFPSKDAMAEVIARAYERKEKLITAQANLIEAKSDLVDSCLASLGEAVEKAESQQAALKLADELAEYLVESVGCNDACDDDCEHKQAKTYQQARKENK